MTAHHRHLHPDETLVAAQQVGDETDLRIRWLVSERLTALGTADGGWDWLFVDREDGRLWELSYPQGSLHGSGPRQLEVVTRERAEAKFGAAALEDGDD